HVDPPRKRPVAPANVEAFRRVWDTERSGQRLLGERPLAYDQKSGPVLAEELVSLEQLPPGLVEVTVQEQSFNPADLEEFAGDLPEQLVLRLVGHTGLAAQADEAEDRDAEDVVEGGQGRECVGQTGVLQQDGRPAPAQGGAGGD